MIRLALALIVAAAAAAPGAARATDYDDTVVESIRIHKPARIVEQVVEDDQPDPWDLEEVAYAAPVRQRIVRQRIVRHQPVRQRVVRRQIVRRQPIRQRIVRQELYSY